MRCTRSSGREGGMQTIRRLFPTGCRVFMRGIPRNYSVDDLHGDLAALDRLLGK